MHSATTNYYHITEDQIYIRAAATTATTATENIEITVMFSVAYLAQSASMSNYRVARNFLDWVHVSTSMSCVVCYMYVVCMYVLCMYVMYGAQLWSLKICFGRQ